LLEGRLSEQPAPRPSLERLRGRYGSDLLCFAAAPQRPRLVREHPVRELVHHRVAGDVLSRAAVEGLNDDDPALPGTDRFLLAGAQLHAGLAFAALG